MSKQQINEWIYFFKTLLQKYKRACLNSRFTTIFIVLIFFFLKLNFEVTKLNWLFWLPPQNSITHVVFGKFEKTSLDKNDPSKPTRIKLLVDKSNEEIFVDCEPQPYLNRCLDNPNYNFFDNRIYKIKYLEYPSNNNYGIEKILTEISLGNRVIISELERIGEIKSTPIIKVGSKYNYKYIRVSGDKISLLLRYLLIGFGLLAMLFIGIIPLIIKLNWEIKNRR